LKITENVENKHQIDTEKKRKIMHKQET